MNAIDFYIIDTKQYRHYSHAAFSIIKLKIIYQQRNDLTDENIINNIIASKYYLWNYEIYPDGYPFFGKKIQIHGPFTRNKITSSDYTSLSFNHFLSDNLNFIINEIILSKISKQKEDRNFLSQLINECFALYNEGNYFKLNLELHSQVNIDSNYYKEKISEWHPFSIFKSYIVINIQKSVLYLIQIGDD